MELDKCLLEYIVACLGYFVQKDAYKYTSKRTVQFRFRNPVSMNIEANNFIVTIKIEELL